MSSNDDYSVDKAERRRRMQSATFALGIAICVVLFACFALGGGNEVSSPVIEIDGRININDAGVASIQRLPGIGANRAKAIILHRELLGGDGDVRVFENPHDLEAISGIGPKTVAGLEDYVKFE